MPRRGLPPRRSLGAALNVRGEIDLVMGQIGCRSLDQLVPDFLWCDDWTQNR
jgi:hypothetical protein